MTRRAGFLTFLLATGLSASLRAEGLEVGVAAVTINPPKGYRMAGYYADRLNTGTRDDLQAHAIVFRQGQIKAAPRVLRPHRDPSGNRHGGTP